LAFNLLIRNPVKLGKRKQRSQMCELFTEDGRIIDIEMDVLRSCVDDPNSKQAFLIDAVNQYVNMDDKAWTQVLWEPSAYPLRMINPQEEADDFEKLSDQIYEETWSNTKQDQYDKAKKDEQGNRVTWIVSIVCTAAVIISLIQWAGG